MGTYTLHRLFGSTKDVSPESRHDLDAFFSRLIFGGIGFPKACGIQLILAFNLASPQCFPTRDVPGFDGMDPEPLMSSNWYYFGGLGGMKSHCRYIVILDSFTICALACAGFFCNETG
jgi:hypothetical protein